MSPKNAKRYVTTAIPYVNAEPHIGFALELVQADVIARLRREAGDDTWFLTGTDENAVKNVQAAEASGVAVPEFVERNAEKFRALTKALDVSNDDFIRTTEERHREGARKLWEACAKNGDIYKKTYEGLYCIGCEAFVLEKDLVDSLCPEHKRRPELVREENYFFKLTNYADFLKDAIEKRAIRVHPRGRQNEVVSFIERGLEDFSISRSRERAKNWGVGVPDDNTQVMYVWFDALANYITALGYGSSNQGKFDAYWSADDANITHVIGKGITRFHAIYWPAMLKSAGIFPHNGLDIVVHGYVTVDGEKISKSLGNTVDPFALVEKYGGDAMRYFLLREIPAFEDGDFTIEKFKERYNADLADGLGNLVARTLRLAEGKLRNLDKATSIPSDDPRKIDLEYPPIHAYLDRSWNKPDVLDQYDLTPLIPESPSGYYTIEVSGFNSSVSATNKYIELKKPWISGPDQEQNIAGAAAKVLDEAIGLRPFLPETSRKILESFGVDPAIKKIDRSLKISAKRGGVLFPKLL